MSCGAHSRPVFACASCIEADKLGIIEEAKKTTPAPPCPECGRPTVYHEATTKPMTLYFYCTAGWTKDGTPVCDGEAEVRLER